MRMSLLLSVVLSVHGVVQETSTASFYEIKMSDNSMIPTGTYALNIPLHFDRSYEWTIQFDSEPTIMGYQNVFHLHTCAESSMTICPSPFQGMSYVVQDVRTTTTLWDTVEKRISFWMGYDFFHLDPMPYSAYYEQRHVGHLGTDFTFKVPAVQDRPPVDNVLMWYKPDIFPPASSATCTNHDGSACNATRGNYDLNTWDLSLIHI